MLLDASYSHSLAIARELREDLDAEVISVGPSGALVHRSRYSVEKVIGPSAGEPGYEDWLCRIADRINPDIVVPVGFGSFSALYGTLDGERDRLASILPEFANFELATSKTATYAAASSVGIRHPRNLTEKVRSGALSRSIFPVFAKADHERGGMSTEIVHDESDMERVLASEWGDDAIFQEFIESDGTTLAYQGYFRNGSPVVEFGHVEQRSVPRRGGSGTRVSLLHDSELFQVGRNLMASLEWSGVAQIEFKRASDGDLVLMELNPKFWASYALGSWAGHRVATAAVSDALAMVYDPPIPARADGTMVFPIREFGFVLRNLKSENVLGAAWHMLYPPAVWDVRGRDVWTALRR